MDPWYLKKLKKFRQIIIKCFRSIWYTGRGSTRTENKIWNGFSILPKIIQRSNWTTHAGKRIIKGKKLAAKSNSDKLSHQHMPLPSTYAHKKESFNCHRPRAQKRKATVTHSIVPRIYKNYRHNVCGQVNELPFQNVNTYYCSHETFVCLK